jgi:hypothetical protein
MPPSTGAHATPAGNNWTEPHSTYRVRPHQTVGLDGCQLLFPVAKWVGVYRSVQRPHPIAPQAAVFEYLNPLKRRERTQNDIAKTAAAEQTLQVAVNARADDEKYCDYRQEDWASFRSRVDAAHVCCPRQQPAHHDLQGMGGCAGVLCWVGASLAGRCFVARRVLRWDSPRQGARSSAALGFGW